MVANTFEDVTMRSAGDKMKDSKTEVTRLFIASRLCFVLGGLLASTIIPSHSQERPLPAISDRRVYICDNWSPVLSRIIEIPIKSFHFAFRPTVLSSTEFIATMSCGKRSTAREWIARTKAQVTRHDGEYLVYDLPKNNIAGLTTEFYVDKNDEVLGACDKKLPNQSNRGCVVSVPVELWMNPDSNKPRLVTSYGINYEYRLHLADIQQLVRQKAEQSVLQLTPASSPIPN
jgi:hypothetical protein